MTLQQYLPESMEWIILGRLESRQTQGSFADSVGTTRNIFPSSWSRFQETWNVRHRLEKGRLRVTTATDDRYKLLTVYRDRLDNATPLERQLLLKAG